MVSVHVFDVFFPYQCRTFCSTRTRQYDLICKLIDKSYANSKSATKSLRLVYIIPVTLNRTPA